MADLLHTLTGVALAIGAGFAFSYAVTLGRLFGHLVGQNRQEFFAEVYAPFRDSSNLKIRYGLFLPGAPFFIGLISLFCNAGQHALWPQIAGLALFPAYYLLIHRPSGYAAVEERLNSGEGLDERQSQTYLRWNLPLHYLLGGLYAAASLMILLT